MKTISTFGDDPVLIPHDDYLEIKGTDKSNESYRYHFTPENMALSAVAVLIFDLFLKGQKMITMSQEIQMLIHELFKAKLEDKLVAVLRRLYGMREEEELDELSFSTLDRYRSKASSQLRRGTYGASAYDSLRTKMRKRTNRIRGLKQADNRIEKHDDDENEKPVNEGLGDAFSHLARHTAAQTIASGLGLHPALVHAFVAHLKQRQQQRKTTRQQQTTKKPKAAAPQKQNQKQQPPQQHTKAFEPVEMHHVFHGTPSEHEHPLVQALNHHNIGMFAKSKNDHSKAEIHFRARDKHFKSYASKHHMSICKD